jgi:hypothetical protein
MKVDEFKEKYPVEDYEGFVSSYLELVYRFLDTAVENHRSEPPLSEINEHVIVLEDPETILNHYEKPIVMTWLADIAPDYATIASDRGTANFRVVVWTEDLDPGAGQFHALLQSLIYSLSIANNLENNRSLVGANGDAAAEDTVVTNIAPDTTIPSGSGMKFTAMDVEVEYKRRIPR